MNSLDTEFSGLEAPLSLPSVLVKKLQKLPVRPEVTFRFVDFDGTLVDDDVRFRVDPELHHHRADKAIPYIMEKYGSPDDPTGFKTFVKKIIEKLREENANFQFENTKDIFDPTNPDDYILTAGNVIFQKEKIDNAGFPPEVNKLLVLEAPNKPLVMLLTCLKRGFIPGKIQFYDDRIKNFDGVDRIMSEILGIPVDFFRVVPNYAEHRVMVHKYASQIESILTAN